MDQESTRGSIIVMAYPANFAKLSNEGISKITPFIGMGNKHGIKVGHAALCTINHETGSVNYYDFGRYVTPEGKGRVRNVFTDEELHVPIDAIMENGEVANLNEILIWLEAHPEKTHGEGTLVASVCSDINLDAAEKFIIDIHTKGSIPYGVFVKSGSNCARFVFDTIMASCEDKKMYRKLLREKIITPSPLGILGKASTSGSVYTVLSGVIKTRKPFQRLEILKYFFQKPDSSSAHHIPFTCDVPNAHYLSGVGSQAYFTLEALEAEGEYRITRFTENESGNCTGIFVPVEGGFHYTQNYEFIYDSNCHHCHIKQNDKIFRFNKKTSK
ncbi:MAG: hypothetical protein ACJAV6_000549 [Candidatus Paceibacteria bacterium]|jgi:hypothetical protein